MSSPTSSTRTTATAVRRVAVLAALLVAASLLTSCGKTVTAPDVVGLRLDAAHRKFEKLGVDGFDDKDHRKSDRTTFRDHNWVVIKQSPAAGTKNVDADTKIKLTVAKYSDHDILELIPADSKIAKHLTAKAEKAAAKKAKADAKKVAAKAKRDREEAEAKARSELPHLATRASAKKFFDKELGLDVDWKVSNTFEGRPRYLGIVDGTSAIIEIFGPNEAIDEIGYAVVYDGTDVDTNFQRALPMILMAREYASESAAKFVGGELDEISANEAIPEHKRTKRFGKLYANVYSVDVVGMVGMTISIGHRPSPEVD